MFHDFSAKNHRLVFLDPQTGDDSEEDADRPAVNFWDDEDRGLLRSLPWSVGPGNREKRDVVVISKPVC